MPKPPPKPDCPPCLARLSAPRGLRGLQGLPPRSRPEDHLREEGREVRDVWVEFSGGGGDGGECSVVEGDSESRIDRSRYSGVWYPRHETSGGMVTKTEFQRRAAGPVVGGGRKINSQGLTLMPPGVGF